MKLSKKQLLALAALAVIFAASFAYAADARKSLELNYPTLPGNPPLTLSANTTLPQLLQYFFTFFVVIGGLIAFGSIVYAGFLFMTSGANPGLRAKAMARIRQAMLGLVLLLSTYIILNTINPELVFLREPGRDLVIPKYEPLGSIQSVFDTIDYASLRYGGVVVFDEPDTSGATGKSETIFHDVSNFKESTYINNNSSISAVKILGDCAVELTPTSDRGVRQTNSISQTFSEVNPLNNNIRSLVFTGKGRGCLGHSIKVFEGQNYNDKGIITSAKGVTFVPGAQTLLTNAPDLSNLRFMPTLGVKPSLDNTIRSIKLAIDLPPGGRPSFTAQLCDEKEYKSCTELTQSTSALSSALDKKISSIQFTSPTRRQAGVIVYRDENFGGFHEVFIASDKNLNPGIVNGSGGAKEISSFQIIGNYKVTFYEKPNFDTSGAWVAIDNTDQEHPRGTVSPQLSGTGNLPGSTNDVFGVADLRQYCFLKPGVNECTQETFNDKISSIKIEVPVDLYLPQSEDHPRGQNLGDKRICPDNLCEL